MDHKAVQGDVFRFQPPDASGQSGFPGAAATDVDPNSMNWDFEPADAVVDSVWENIVAAKPIVAGIESGDIVTTPTGGLKSVAFQPTETMEWYDRTRQWGGYDRTRQWSGYDRARQRSG